MCSSQHPQCFHHSKHLEAGANERKIASTRGEEEGHCTYIKARLQGDGVYTGEFLEHCDRWNISVRGEE